MIDLAATFGYIRNEGGCAVIDNRIFEIKITNYFISRNLEDPKQVKITGVLTEDVIQDDAYEQLYGHLESMHAAEGYLLTFDHHQQKKPKTEWICYREKGIFEVVI